MSTENKNGEEEEEVKQPNTEEEEEEEEEEGDMSAYKLDSEVRNKHRLHLFTTDFVMPCFSMVHYWSPNFCLSIGQYACQDQDSLLVKRRNDNHSPGPVIRE